MQGLSGFSPRSVPVLISTVLLTLAGLVEARSQQRLQVDLIQTGTAESTEYPVTPDGHDFFMGVSEWRAPELKDPRSPLRGLHGRCFGATEYEGEIIVAGGGYCTYEDADGDRLVTRWTPKEQLPVFRTRGEWTVFAGSGKWEGASGAGSYETARTTGGSERSRRLNGEIVLPGL